MAAGGQVLGRDRADLRAASGGVDGERFPPLRGGPAGTGGCHYPLRPDLVSVLDITLTQQGKHRTRRARFTGRLRPARTAGGGGGVGGHPVASHSRVRCLDRQRPTVRGLTPSRAAVSRAEPAVRSASPLAVLGGVARRPGRAVSARRTWRGRCASTSSGRTVSSLAAVSGEVRAAPCHTRRAVLRGTAASSAI